MTKNKQQLAAYDEAVKRLTEKMHSTDDLKIKLLRKGFANDEVYEALATLTKEGFLNDRSYAENYIQNLIAYRTFGYYGIRNKLLQKRLAKNLIDELLPQFVTNKIEQEIGQRFWEKNQRAGRSPRSLAQAMRQKGFRTDVILKILKKDHPG